MTSLRRILCLQLLQWPIARLLAERPEWKSRWLILQRRDARRGLCVAACCEKSRQAGVRVNMPLAEASTLVERKGKLLILPHSPAEDLAALTCLAEKLERFSPMIGWQTLTGSLGPPPKMRARQQPDISEAAGANLADSTSSSTGPDRLLLDITGIGLLFGGELTLANEVQQACAALGYGVSLGIANTVGGAWALAQERVPLAAPPQRKVTSSEVTEADKIAEATTELAPAVLATLPLSAFRFSPTALSTLSQLGIQTLADLLQLPRSSVTARLGPEVLWRVDQALGAIPEPIIPHRPAPPFAAEVVLEYPTNLPADVERFCQTLLQQLVQQLSPQRLGITRLTARLDIADEAPLQLSLSLYSPVLCADYLWQLLRLQLEKQPLTGWVGRIGLQVCQTARLEKRQRELFSDGSREQGRQVAQLVDQLSSRLGPAAVLRAQRTSDPLPERAFRYRPFTAGKGSPGAPPATTCLQRPIFLATESQPIQVLAATVPTGPPEVFRWQGRQYQVACYAGPERIETGWWRGASVRRDYYRIETTTGWRFWLFYVRRDNRWHWHGACG